MTTALLVIDMQIGLLEGERPVYHAAPLIERIHRLSEHARSAAIPVIYVQDDDVGPVGEPGWQLHPALAVPADAMILRKKYADSFYHTPLQDLLGDLGVTALVVAGCATDACIEMTCRRAVSLGYDVTLVADGHSTHDNSVMPAPQSIKYYNLVLDGFGGEDG
ncbi:MAG TPA: cysteine hydrolase family protein, partial [Roseiflexaceae bacterium]|nr:cysteine hydrolase family protein [Roseiflexaceae bacterium]